MSRRFSTSGNADWGARFARHRTTPGVLEKLPPPFISRWRGASVAAAVAIIALVLFLGGRS